MANESRRRVANPVKDQGTSKRRTKEITDRARARGRSRPRPPAGDAPGGHPGERGGLTAGGGVQDLGRAARGARSAEPKARAERVSMAPPPRRGDVAAADEMGALEDWPANARRGTRSVVGGAARGVGRLAGRTRSGGRAKQRRKARGGRRQRGR